MPVLNQLNERAYQRLNQTLLNQPTRCEKKLHLMIQDPIRTPLVLHPKIWNNQLMYPRYLFDTTLTVQFPNEFYKWWKTNYAFAGSPVEHVKVRLIANTNRTLEHFFIHRKPPKEMLTKMEPS